MTIFKRRDILYTLILILFSIVAVYFAPGFKSTFFLLVLIIFFLGNPNHDYFWVFFVLVIVDNPGNLFWHTAEKVIKIGPIYLSFLQLFIITAVFKIILNKKSYLHIKVFFAKNSIPFFIWLVFLLIEGLYIGIEGGGQTGYRYYYNYGLTFIIFPIFFVMPYLIKDINSLINLFRLISIFLIFNVMMQITNIVVGYDLHFLLAGTIPVDYDYTSIGKANKLIRPLYFVYSSFFAFILAPFFLYLKDKIFNRTFLYVVFFIGFFSMVITATRGWIIAYIVYLLLLILLDIFYTKKFIPQKFIIRFTIVIVILISSNPIIQDQLSGTIKRMDTLMLLFKGDKTAGGTNSRLTTRLLPVMKKFEAQPITGWGFSREGMENFDGHVGNASLLMISGIIGTFIMLLFILNILKKYYYLFKLLLPLNPYKNGIIVLLGSFVILLIIHSTSSQIFGYYRFINDGGSGALWISIYLSILNVIYNSAIENEENLEKV